MLLLGEQVQSLKYLEYVINESEEDDGEIDMAGRSRVK